ncbi:MAG: hydrolase, partial [Bacteroidia bacterium]|nr:hydrolase [Bacteroidia bacterium]
RYITASIDQKTFNMSLRMNYTISPNFTIQYWGQPFISKAQYSDFKYITNSLAKNYEERFELLEGAQVAYEAATSHYHIDEDMDGNVDYSIGDPDFNFIQFRSNLVARWEYIPGSELFLVWSQGLTNSGDPTESLIPSLTDNVFKNKANNIFLMKFTYRFIK